MDVKHLRECQRFFEEGCYHCLDCGKAIDMEEDDQYEGWNLYQLQEISKLWLCDACEYKKFLREESAEDKLKRLERGKIRENKTSGIGSIDWIAAQQALCFGLKE